MEIKYIASGQYQVMIVAGKNYQWSPGWCGSVHWAPVNWKVAGLIPNQGTHLGRGPGPWLGV